VDEVRRVELWSVDAAGVVGRRGSVMGVVMVLMEIDEDKEDNEEAPE
jgi:hypothetical protein